MMTLSFSYDLSEQFDYPSDLLGQLEFEISLKNKAQTDFSGKTAKNHKGPGRDL